MIEEDYAKVHELKEEYYVLHSRLVNDQLKRCDNDEQKQLLLEEMSDCNSPYGRDEKA